MKLDNRLVITRWREGILSVLFQENKAVEMDFQKETQASLLGNIYVGRVANVVKNIQAAFVEIESGISCYYPLPDDLGNIIFTKKGKSPRLEQGDEFLVQVSRESVKMKAPSVTEEITISGKYLVAVIGKEKISFSSKLSAEEKLRLRSLTEEFGETGIGWIVRTNAAQGEEDEIKAEAAYLANICRELLKKAPFSPGRSCLYKSPAEYLQVIKNLKTEQYEEIVTDDKDLYDEIITYLEYHSFGKHKPVRLYKDRMLPMYKLYGIEHVIEEAGRERIWLKSGGFLVIQPTEALTVVDVNTGKYDGKKSREEAFLKINLEAARESARQIRLRNISGIIIIDFINMASREHQKKVMDLLASYLKNDSQKATVVDMTPLGLVEVTRKRQKRSFLEKMS